MVVRALKRILGAAAVVFFGGLLLFCAPAVAQGAQRGLAVCGSVVVPALYPFLVLSCIVGAVALPAPAQRLLGFLARRVYALPESCAPALLMSWVGGYPAGAKVLAGMVRTGRVSRGEAARAMTACVNSGPAFMAAVVGSIFGSAQIGLKIFGCQLAAGIVTAWVFALLGTSGERRDAPPPAPKGANACGAAETFVSAVGGAASASLTICAFAILFSALLAAFDSLGLTAGAAFLLQRLSGGFLQAGSARCLVSGLLEICCGCSCAASLPPAQAAAVLPFLLSFGSLSVACQNAAFFAGTGVSMLPMFLSRFLHGILTTLFTFPWLYRATAALNVFAPDTAVALGKGFSPLSAVFLLVLTALLYISAEFSLKFKNNP